MPTFLQFDELDASSGRQLSRRMVPNGSSITALDRRLRRIVANSSI